MAGVCSVGANAVYVGVVPTPAVAYLTKTYNVDAGVVISASHNPVEFNGIKFFDGNGYKLPDAMEDEIEALINSNMDGVNFPTGSGVGKIKYRTDACEEYINHSIRSVNVDLSGLKIVERYNHSVDLYGDGPRACPIGYDATVLYGYKDLRVKNMTNATLRFKLIVEKDVIFAVEQTLKKGAGYSALQKRKLRIDQLTAQKKYVAAVREYDALLPSFEDGKGGSVLLSQMLHNKAVALAGLMLYAEAAEVFRKAYEADGNEESLACAFAAKRMVLTDREYVDYLAQCPEGY
jgi:hypothetical protein